jgi:hypothetical protein
MKILEYKGHELHLPTSGGKAGTGHNVTSTVQARRGGCIVKQARYKMYDVESYKKALRKVREFIDLQTP